MDYPLYNMHDEDFQNLVALICEQILGTATIVFSRGKDGGKDAKFKGTANNFPSKSSPWTGKFIIQAKHTSNPIASCSGSSFKTILKKELPRIKKLKDNDEVDFYIVFTNRKLSGIQDARIEDLIEEKLDIENRVFGIEKIQLWLQEYPKIVRTLGLNDLLLPLQFYEKDLQEIIVTFSKVEFSEKSLRKIQDDLNRIPIEEKNKLNNLGNEYFNHVFKESYSDFEKITIFLGDPQNKDFLIKYNNTVSDLQSKIIIKRSEFTKFEEIIDHLFNLIFDTNNVKLLNNRKLIRTFLHYMYFYCDIGLKEEANAEA